MHRLPIALFLSARLAAALFNIVDIRGTTERSVLSTEAFRSAIQAAKAAGGGTVFIPPGRFTTGPIELVSNVNLQFDAGAVVHFPAMRLPFTKGRQQGVECLTPVPLIGGNHLDNVTISGRGLLSTGQAEWLDLMGRPQFAEHRRARNSAPPGTTCSSFSNQETGSRNVVPRSRPIPQAVIHPLLR